MCDFFGSDVVVKDFVKENEGCMDFVRDVVDLIYFRYCDNFFVLFRKLFEIFFFVVIWGEELFCYFFGENSWCMLCKILFEYGEL